MIEKMEEKTSFEENMKKLEEIATELEKGDLDLDTSVSKFEEGMKLSKECSEMLEKAENNDANQRRKWRISRRKFC